MMLEKPVRDPATLLIRAVLVLAGPHASLDEHRGTSWASATFTGMWHAMRLRFAGDEGVAAANRLSEGISEHEFALPGHIVADISVSERQLRTEGEPMVSLTLEALTVEDR